MSEASETATPNADDAIAKVLQRTLGMFAVAAFVGNLAFFAWALTR